MKSDLKKRKDKADGKGHIIGIVISLFILLNCLIIPSQAFTLHLIIPEESTIPMVVDNVEVYVGDILLGTTNETGFLYYKSHIGYVDQVAIKYDLTLKREGYEIENISIFPMYDDQLIDLQMGLYKKYIPPIPDDIILTPIPNYKSPEEKIKELEERLNQTNTTVQQHEQRINWIENIIREVLNEINELIF